MLNELELDKRIQNAFIDDEYFKEIVIEHFNQYCIKLYNKIYDYNVTNIKIFLFDLFNVEEQNGDFYLKTKEEVGADDANYKYVSYISSTRITNIYDFQEYIEQQLNE